MDIDVEKIMPRNMDIRSDQRQTIAGSLECHDKHDGRKDRFIDRADVSPKCLQRVLG